MQYSNDNITTLSDVDIELYISTEVLGLRSLHYGYWEKGVALTIENLRKAQAAYTQTLEVLIPKNVKHILDVGAGIGDNAAYLVRKGYKVTALSPDENHKKYFEKIPKAEFVSTNFEGFTSDKKYDLILMSESQNYFDPVIGFQQCQKFLKPGGYLYISGKFRRTNSQAFVKVTNVLGEYLKLAKEYGFTLEKEVDITDHILPTLAFSKKVYDQYAQPMIALAQYYLKHDRSWKMKMVKLGLALLSPFFKPQLERVNQFYLEHLDTQKFKKHVKYTRLLLKFNPSAIGV